MRSNSDDKRKYPRAPVRVEIICDELKDETRRGEAILCFYSTDISIGGIFLEASVNFKVGDSLHLKFKLPGNNKQVLATGRVVRINKKDSPVISGVGIEFEHLSFEDKKSIEGYVIDEIADQL